MIFKTMKKDIKTWKDVKLYMLQEIHALPHMDDKTDMIIEHLSILLNTDPAEIENMPVSELFNEFEKWNFLKDIPEAKKVDIIKIEGKRYGLVNFKDMSFAQLVDIEEYINDGGVIKNLHKILGTIYLPVDKYNVFTKRYSLKKYEPSDELCEAFRTLDMELLYPVALFFYHIVQTYLKNLVLSSAQMNLQKMKEMILAEEGASVTHKQMLLSELEKLGTGME